MQKNILFLYSHDDVKDFFIFEHERKKKVSQVEINYFQSFDVPSFLLYLSLTRNAMAIGLPGRKKFEKE